MSKQYEVTAEITKIDSHIVYADNAADAADIASRFFSDQDVQNVSVLSVEPIRVERRKGVPR